MFDGNINLLYFNISLFNFNWDEGIEILIMLFLIFSFCFESDLKQIERLYTFLKLPSFYQVFFFFQNRNLTSNSDSWNLSAGVVDVELIKIMFDVARDNIDRNIV